MKSVRKKSKLRMRAGSVCRKRQGASTVDYVLVMGVILPLALFLFAVVPRMVKLVYEFVVVNVTSPMM